MKISVIAGNELGPDLAQKWSVLHYNNPDLSSAFFHPEFTRCVARVRSNVRIAVLEAAGNPVGFLPFERLRGGLAGPVGGDLSDYHGVISAPDLDFDPIELLRASNLIAWDFSHSPLSQKSLRRGIRRFIASPQMDLADGYAAYEARRLAAGSDLVHRVAYLERRLSREIGPLRLAIHEIDDRVLDQILAWKRAKYTASASAAFLPSARAILGVIHRTQADGFSGVLSALYAGDRLIAGHFGICSRESWHYWFPSYDESFSKYSPGLILVLRMAKNANSLGLRMIDLGAGMSDYKSRLATGAVMLSGGSIDLPTFRFVRGVGRFLASGVRNSPLAAPARAILRCFR